MRPWETATETSDFVSVCVEEFRTRFVRQHPVELLSRLPCQVDGAFTDPRTAISELPFRTVDLDRKKMRDLR